MTDEVIKRRRGRPRKASMTVGLMESFKQTAAIVEANITRGLSNGILPRAQRNCGNCDHGRLVGRELRCWKSPPMPCMVGALPPLQEGAPPRPVIVGVQPPTWDWYCCSEWAVRQADHPDIGVIETVPEFGVPVTETRQ